MIVFTLVGIFFSFVYVDHLTEKIVIKLSVEIQLLSYLVTVFSFYFLHIKDFKMHLKKNTSFIEHHYILLIIVIIIMINCSSIYNITMQTLPDEIVFNEPQNELELMNLFDQPS